MALALVRVPADAAPLMVPLGLASATALTAVRGDRSLHLDSLRPRRGDGVTEPPALLVMPEDDTPSFTQRLQRAMAAAGVAQQRVRITASTSAAAAEVLAGASLLLCDGRFARRNGLAWMPLADAGLHRGYELAFAPSRSDETGRHAIETLDPAYANVGSARGLVDLLERVWLDRIAEPSATAELRRLMSMQVFTHRLSSDLRTDLVRLSAKTGTFLHLRHEIGVIESISRGDRVALAALTRSSRRATIAHDIDLSIGAAARSAFEAMRR